MLLIASMRRDTAGCEAAVSAMYDSVAISNPTTALQCSLASEGNNYNELTEELQDNGLRLHLSKVWLLTICQDPNAATHKLRFAASQ